MTGKPENEFWMVWNPAGRSPTFRHTTKAFALAEAERLAKDHPGQNFYVLQAVSRSCSPPQVITVDLCDGIPF